MTIMNLNIPKSEKLRPVVVVADKASLLVRVIAQPSLAQLILRVALAVPFWRSGILKWDGFLRLSDTAVTLFTSSCFTFPGALTPSQPQR